jgi:hypothetical protein
VTAKAACWMPWNHRDTLAVVPPSPAHPRRPRATTWQRFLNRSRAGRNGRRLCQRHRVSRQRRCGTQESMPRGQPSCFPAWQRSPAAHHRHCCPTRTGVQSSVQPAAPNRRLTRGSPAA